MRRCRMWPFDGDYGRHDGALPTSDASAFQQIDLL